MKRRFIVALAALVVLGILAVAVSSIRRARAMPSYQGRTAEAWLDETWSSNQAMVFVAFKAMGSNGVSVLVRALGTGEGPWDRTYQKLYPGLPLLLRNMLTAPMPVEERQSAAELMLLNNRYRKTAFPDVLRILERGDGRTRAHAAALASALIGPEDARAVPVLERCLLDTNYVVRLSAATGLLQIGPNAKAAIPALTNALGDSNLDVRISVAYALWKIDRETNIAARVMKDAMKSGDQPTNPLVSSRRGTRAAIYLSEIDPTDLSPLPVLVGYFDSKDYSLSRMAVTAVGRYGPGAKEAVPALIHKINTGDVDMRHRALVSLKQIDPEAAAKYEGN